MAVFSLFCGVTAMPTDPHTTKSTQGQCSNAKQPMNEAAEPTIIAEQHRQLNKGPSVVASSSAMKKSAAPPPVQPEQPSNPNPSRQPQYPADPMDPADPNSPHPIEGKREALFPKDSDGVRQVNE